MVPLLFRPYAEQSADRAKAFGPKRILETAAGTGVVTDALSRALPDCEIVATDLNQPMLDVAASRVTSPNVTFRQADALSLPFEDASFDLVVCQFGVMFYPDKIKGGSEARRMLRDGGHYLFAVWDRIDRNGLSASRTKVYGGSFRTTRRASWSAVRSAITSPSGSSATCTLPALNRLSWRRSN